MKKLLLGLAGLLLFAFGFAWPLLLGDGVSTVHHAWNVGGTGPFIISLGVRWRPADEPKDWCQPEGRGFTCGGGFGWCDVWHEDWHDWNCDIYDVPSQAPKP
jgi:hypothetical protein